MNSLKRGVARFNTIHAFDYDNVVRTINGKLFNLKRYRVNGNVMPFSRIEKESHAEDEEGVLNERKVLRLYEQFKTKKSSATRSERNGKEGTRTKSEESKTEKERSVGRRGVGESC